METTIECIPCLIKQGIKVAKYLGKTQESTSEMIREILEMLSKESYQKNPPFLSKKIHSIICKHTKEEDPYKNIKTYYNQKVMDMEDALKKRIEDSENKIFESLKLAIAGNIIDFGTENEINENILIESIGQIDKKDLEINDFDKMYQSLLTSKRLLYIGDNCGEIVFDKIFLENIKKYFPDIELYFGVRGNPIINDITEKDAEEVGMEKFAKIINNGDGAPGVVLEDVSLEYKKLFYDVDTVIAKGQGNYETLNDVDRENLYFLFMAKCDVVSNELKVKKGSLICKNQTYQN